MKAIQKIKSNLSKITKVLRHGLFLSLYSYIKKVSSKLPWRSRTYIQNLRNIRIAGLSSSFLLGLLALAIIIPLYNVSGAEDTEVASSYVPSTSSITFTSTRNKATINLTPTSTTGTFIQSDTNNTSEVASFNVATDNATGYTLGIASSTDTTSLTNGTDTLPTIANASSGITAATFNTSTYNDMWGYLPSKYNSTANTGSSAKFFPLTTTTATLDETAVANSTANIYTIALGARVTMSKSSGTYTTPSGTAFVLTAVGKPAAYTISYNANGGSGAPSTQSSTSYSQQSVTLSNTTPTKTGYDFLGWCTKQTSDQTTQSNGSTVCTNAGGTYYAKGGTFYIDETTKNVTTLYAIWYLKDITVTGVFGGSGVTGITFANQTYGNKSITTNNGTTTLKYGASYTISGTYSDNYKFSSWATTAGGTLGSTSSESTTYTVTANSTLTLTGEVAIPTLYETIASMSKGKQTNDTNATTGIQAAITAPTSTDRTQDTSNSGVYEYDVSVFGASSDASNDYPIYYYRGILEPEADQGSYGSDGKATTYPNYVKLSNNTCWRILRTTGSGGVKLIYNGTYGATTAGSCANAQTNAQVITSAFNTNSTSNGYTSLNSQNIHAVGYTYNNSVRNSTSSTAASTVFGSNSTYSVNSSPSIMKQYLENTWYTTNMTSYTSKLESSAGYCNDRSLYASGSYASALAEATTVVPYGTSSMTAYYFGPYTRNSNAAQKPSLTCPRNVVDLYTTSTASNGNKQLTYPVALATADEMSFAGSGRSTASQGSSYNAKSFAWSGSYFWLLSPSYRDSSGNANGYILYSSGYLSGDYVVSYTSGVRPVISLKFGTTPESGSGTATDPWVVTPPTLYDTIASMSKGKQTNDDNTTTGIQAAITAPTSTDRTQDTSNSGVYEYDASLFGASSDASNDYPIYYYRGILEPEADQGSYGSDGKATTYPNYVMLSNNTCWRILRTTGSGGIKLIYNGTYGATTAGSCANAQTNAQLTTKAFENTVDKNIVGVGYTYNAKYKSTTTTTAAGTLFGTNTNYSGNTSPSTMKTYIEDTWYKSNMDSYTSMLEPSAGYCNDRSVNTGSSWTTYSDSTSITTPYSSASSGNTNTTFYFGARMRNNSTYQKPSLTCPRNVVDLYTTSSASNGNKQLGYPVALATADEMGFAGSGSYTASQGSSYNAKSFAGSGSYFWLLSPYARNSYGNARGYFLFSGGNLNYSDVTGAYGVRPVISLTSGTTPESGSGTATDPWVVTPPTMQDATSSSLADLMPNVGDTATLIDSRDGESYLIGHLADGKYWMLDNLAIDLVSTKSTLSSSNTNATDAELNYLKGTSTGTTSDQYATAAIANWTSSYSYSAPLQSLTDKDKTVTSYGSGSGKVGGYYNYCAASAGTYCYGNGTSYGTSSGNATADICPKGWQMPSTTSSNNVAGSYYYLYNTAYSANASNFRTALSTPLSGYFFNGSASDQGSHGYFWSSTRYIDDYMYYLYVNSSDVYPTNSSDRYRGYSVRCILK